MSNQSEQLRAIQKKFILITLLGTPGPILVGLGLYGVFDVQDDAFIPLLNDLRVSYAAIGIGGVIMAAELLAIVKLLIRKSAILKNPGC